MAQASCRRRCGVAIRAASIVSGAAGKRQPAAAAVLDNIRAGCTSCFIEWTRAAGAHTRDSDFRIRIGGDEPRLAAALAQVLLDCVEGGASVSFMWPLPLAKALEFWDSVLVSAQRGERIVLLAEDSATGDVVGTVQVVFAVPDNQPHRADVAKMLVHRRARRCGLGAALLKPRKLRRARPAGHCWCWTRSAAVTPSGSTPAWAGSGWVSSPGMPCGREAACAIPRTSTRRS
jgi:GNAT superfamily N-acetyltransferase